MSIFSNLAGMFGSAAQSAANAVNPMAMIKAQAAKAGLDPKMFEEIMAEMKVIADNKALSQQDQMRAMRDVFIKRGFPGAAIDQALLMAQKKMGQQQHQQ